MNPRIAVLAGDGIGPEIIAQAMKVLDALRFDGPKIELEEAPYGALATTRTAIRCRSNAQLAARPMRFSSAPSAARIRRAAARPKRPDRPSSVCARIWRCSPTCAPAMLIRGLVSASTLKPEVVAGLDILIIRDLTGDVYFGEPRGTRFATDGPFQGHDEGFDTMRYSARRKSSAWPMSAFSAAQKRSKRLCSVDKANVLETIAILARHDD